LNERSGTTDPFLSRYQLRLRRRVIPAGTSSAVMPVLPLFPKTTKSESLLKEALLIQRPLELFQEESVAAFQ